MVTEIVSAIAATRATKKNQIFERNTSTYYFAAAANASARSLGLSSVLPFAATVT